MRIEGLKISGKFIQNIDEFVQDKFWDEFMLVLDKNNLIFGGGHDDNKFQGYIEIEPYHDVNSIIDQIRLLFSSHKCINQFIIEKDEQ